MIDFAFLKSKIKEQWRLSAHSVHGEDHWHQVMRNGLFLSKKTGADETVVKLFALFHDSCRLDDLYDGEHGSRSADLAEKWRGVYYELDDGRFRKLYHACRYHTHEHSAGDATIDTCYDADRLDLGRVGFILDPERFATPYGKKLAVLSHQVSPDQVRDFLLEYFRKKDF